MFWQSITGGLTVLGNTEVLLGLAAYMLIAGLVFLYIALSEPRLTVEDLELQRMREELFQEPPTPRSMSFWQVTVFSIVNSLALAVMIAWLLPLLLGFSLATRPAVLFEMTWSIVAYAAIAWAGMWVIAFIPLVRGIVARSPGLQVFLTGVIILQCLLPTFHGLPSYGHGLLASPGIIESIGYLILTGILVRLMWFLSFSLFHLIESRGGMPHDLRVAPKVIAPLLTMLVGFSHYSCMLAT